MIGNPQTGARRKREAPRGRRMFQYLSIGLAVSILSTGCDAIEEIATALIDFGDDSGDYSFDGQCDDNRFVGPSEFSLHWPGGLYNYRDATDCRRLYQDGRITYIG